MKKFQWRLQRVLDLKEKQEQVYKSELMEITEKLAMVRSQLLMEKQRLRDSMNIINQLPLKQRMKEQELFLQTAKVNDEIIENHKNRIVMLTKDQEEKKQQLREVRRFREGLEKLKEKAWEEYVEEMNKEEQKDLNLFATSTFANKQEKMKT